ncbi:MATE family efflux transporter [Schaalia naturae]|uniref:MATE family efflux transporter n=1 Tax=Schaalia naturae TaxID=635203 RepID=UPI00362C8090
MAGGASVVPPPDDPPSLTRRVLALAVPALGALVAEPLFVLIDTAMVGHLGTESLAGLALGSTVLQTIVGVFVFLAYSTTALAAQALGAGRRDRAVRSGIEAMWLAAGLGLVAAAALMAAGPALVRALGAGPGVAPAALDYIRASSPGLVGMFVVLAGTGTLRGLLDTRTPLVVAAGGAALNVAANAVLIFGADLGVAGSGAGTALAQTLMAAAYIRVVARGARGLGVPLRPSMGGMWRAMLDGAPLFVRTVALRVALLATVSTAAAIGVQALAAHQIVNSLWNLTALVLDALAIAAQALVGYALGAGDPGRLRDLVRRLAVWGAGAGAVRGVLVGAASPWLPALFGDDPGMRGIASAALLVAAVCLPLGGVVFLLDGVLIGASQGRFLAGAGLVTLIAYLPALGGITAWVRSRPDEGGALAPADQTTAMILLWAAFAGLFMGARGLCNAWRTWWSPRHALANSAGRAPAA